MSLYASTAVQKQTSIMFDLTNYIIPERISIL